MKAITYNPGFDRFSITKQPIPEPGPHDVRGRVLACGLNPVDAKIDQWQAMAPAWVPPGCRGWMFPVRSSRSAMQ